jgi:hypothetical protein
VTNCYLSRWSCLLWSTLPLLRGIGLDPHSETETFKLEALALEPDWFVGA